MQRTGRAETAVGRSRPAPVFLEQFSTRLDPELLERLRAAAPRLGLHQYEITAEALDAYLTERRC
jgi:predicted DNA-binding protein